MEYIKSFINNPIKSDKPFMLTFAESIVYAIVVISFGLFALYLDYYFQGELHKFKLWSTWRSVFIQFMVIGVIVAFVLEYSGFNKMLCSTSMQYYNKNWKESLDAKKKWKRDKQTFGVNSTQAQSSFLNYEKTKSKLQLD